MKHLPGERLGRFLVSVSSKTIDEGLAEIPIVRKQSSRSPAMPNGFIDLADACGACRNHSVGKSAMRTEAIQRGFRKVLHIGEPFTNIRRGIFVFHGLCRFKQGIKPIHHVRGSSQSTDRSHLAAK